MPFDALQSAAFGGASTTWPQRPHGPSRAAGDRRRRAGRVAGLAGRAAEEQAVRWYRRRGAEILARNWRAGREDGGGEIDLVVLDRGAVVFVEVKARRTAAEAAHAVTSAQWRRLEAAALRFMVSRKTGDADMRFDVALVGRDGTLEVVENARMT